MKKSTVLLTISLSAVLAATALGIYNFTSINAEEAQTGNTQTYSSMVRYSNSFREQGSQYSPTSYNYDGCMYGDGDEGLYSAHMSGNGMYNEYYDGDSKWNDSSVSIEIPESDLNNVSDPYGATAALLDDDGLTIDEMLQYAIQDEYLAHAEYAQIIEDFGAIAPYRNILNAEEEHISLLEPLFSVYNIPLPEDDADQHVIPAISLLEAAQNGVTAEINNINMYDLFLEQNLPNDMKEVFTSLRNASVNHLIAYERQVTRLS